MIQCDKTFINAGHALYTIHYRGNGEGWIELAKKEEEQDGRKMKKTSLRKGRYGPQSVGKS